MGRVRGRGRTGRSHSEEVPGRRVWPETQLGLGEGSLSRAGSEWCSSVGQGDGNAARTGGGGQPTGT